jgi:hypothetical protein
MAFLDNSGDIILDAVLTDTGRMRLSKGDGSFKITKFALGDDEIDYSLYNPKNPNGTAYYDLEILQTPVLEAFTNNIASMKSKLISISRNNLLYLPVVKLDVVNSPVTQVTSLVRNGYILAVDTVTEQYLSDAALTYDGQSFGNEKSGLLKGQNPGTTKTITIAQGIDSQTIPYSTIIDQDLKEVQYLVEIDNRFAGLVNPIDTSKETPISYIDDDNIATYYLSYGTDPDYVKDYPNATTSNDLSIIAGPRGTRLEFKLTSRTEVSTSPYLFDKLGKALTLFNNGEGKNIKGILTNIRVTGITTGNSIDIPLLLVKRIL